MIQLAALAMRAKQIKKYMDMARRYWYIVVLVMVIPLIQILVWASIGATFLGGGMGWTGGGDGDPFLDLNSGQKKTVTSGSTSMEGAGVKFYSLCPVQGIPECSRKRVEGKDCTCYRTYLENAAELTGVPALIIASIDWVDNKQKAKLATPVPPPEGVDPKEWKVCDCNDPETEKRLLKIGKDVQDSNSERDDAGNFLNNVDGMMTNTLHEYDRLTPGEAMSVFRNYHCYLHKQSDNQWCHAEAFTNDRQKFYRKEKWLWGGYDVPSDYNDETNEGSGSLKDECLGAVGWYKNYIDGDHKVCTPEEVSKQIETIDCKDTSCSMIPNAKLLQSNGQADTPKPKPKPEQKDTECKSDKCDSSTASKAVDLAMGQVGNSYVYGANGGSGVGGSYGDFDPSTIGGDATFDCSGLVGWAYYWATGGDLSLPRSTLFYTDGSTSGVGTCMNPDITLDNLQKGDLIVMNDLSHVVMYAGDGQIVQAANEDLGIIVSPLSSVTSYGSVDGIIRPCP